MYKKINILFIFALLLFAIIPLVQSVPPATTVQTFGEGYVLKYPSDQILKYNSSYSFEFHVFNISNGYPIITGISCDFHLYNSSGEHLLLLHDNSPSNIYDYSFDVDANNFTTLGDYYYIAQCNSSTKGGFVEVPFEVTPNGLEITTGRAIIDIGILGSLIIFLIMTLFIFIRYDNLLVKVGVGSLNYLILIAISFIAWNMANDFLLSAPFVASMFKLIFMILVIGLFPLIIGMFAWYFIMLTKTKTLQDLMEKGFSYEDAQRRTSRSKR